MDNEVILVEPNSPKPPQAQLQSDQSMNLPNSSSQLLQPSHDGQASSLLESVASCSSVEIGTPLSAEKEQNSLDQLLGLYVGEHNLTARQVILIYKFSGNDFMMASACLSRGPTLASITKLTCDRFDMFPKLKLSASELSPYSRQLRFQIYIYMWLYVKSYVHAQ